ncbi:MAG TPA: CDP-paratose 2-epimerase, partial [Acidobacteriota bacterium]|nr:CDP-paratose 2-epimerase [Acidobacteriota bacterium]
GPYRAWIHTHRFTATDGGTLVEAEVRYDVPGGALVNALFVRNDVARIFAYREAKLRARFGAE